MVRFGIIGMGNMGRSHANYLLQGQIKNAELVAICDLVKPTDEIYKDLKFYYDYKELIDSGDVDAVIIATPHYYHTIIGCYSLSKKIHTLTEKPFSVHKKDCLKFIEAHDDPEVIFSCMFNQRTRPQYQKMKELVPELGRIQRITGIFTDWYRTMAYYNSSSWRATWKGEGGGVLMNQCTHQMDLVQWLCGVPKSVFANVTFGKFHDIEVEDEVNAVFEYENGAIGSFIGSTGEYPGTNSLDISGEYGRLFFEKDTLKYWKNDRSAIKYAIEDVGEKVTEAKAKTTANYFNNPLAEYKEFKFNEGTNFLIQHATITQSFVDAITEGKPLIAPAEEGLNSVEMANAIIMSSVLGKKISLPIDPDEYAEILEKLKAKGK